MLFLFISSVAYITRFERSKGLAYHWLVNSASESVLVLYVLYYLWIIITRIVPSRGSRKDASNRLAGLVEQAPEMALFLFTCLLILLCIPLRLLHLRNAEDFVAALVMFLLPLKLLFFCRASNSLGSFIVMIYKILVNDVLCFVVFLIIFVAGFSQCRYFWVCRRDFKVATKNTQTLTTTQKPS